MPKSFYLTSTERAIASSHHGTKRARLTQDAQRPFDSCGLCLAPLVDPVATPSGYLFCRECILENLLAQTQALTLKRRIYEGEMKKREREAELEKNRPAVEEKARFEAAEKGIGIAIHQQHLDSSNSKTSSSSTSSSSLSSSSIKIDPRTHSEKAKDAALTAFWTSTPSVQEDSINPQQQRQQHDHINKRKQAELLVKPDPSPRDPVSGSLFKVKDLLKVNFTLTSSTTSSKVQKRRLGAGHEMGNNEVVDEEEEEEEEEESSTGGGEDVDSAQGGARISCPVCLKGILWQRTFLLRVCGHVLCEGCVLNLCLPSKECAVCSSLFPPDDPKSALLALQVGGSSFSQGAGTQAESSRKTYTNLIS